eukprot:4824173-Amphidinium_carterae.1
MMLDATSATVPSHCQRCEYFKTWALGNCWPPYSCGKRRLLEHPAKTYAMTLAMFSPAFTSTKAPHKFSQDLSLST